MLRRSGVRPAVRAALALVALPLLAACSVGEESGSDSHAARSASVTGSPSESASAKDPSVRKQWAEALATRSEPIGFEVEVAALGDGVPDPLLSTRGAWQSGPDAWSADATALDPQTGKTYEFGVRSAGDDLWLQLRGKRMPPDVWLAMGPGEFPLGQLALVAGEPRYLTVLDEVRGVNAIDPEDGAGTIEGVVPLSEALGLFTEPSAEILGFPDPSVARGTVHIIIDLVGPGVEGYRISGSDLVAAAEAAGGRVDETYRSFMEQLTLEVDLEDDAEAPDTRVPDPSRVFSSDDLSSYEST